VAFSSLADLTPRASGLRSGTPRGHQQFGETTLVLVTLVRKNQIKYTRGCWQYGEAADGSAAVRQPYDVQAGKRGGGGEDVDLSPAGGEQLLPVRRQDHLVHRALVNGERMHAEAQVRVPDLEKNEFWYFL
jgi:hypothetical protein